MAKRKGTSPITLILLGLLALSLGGFGVTQFGGSVQTVATVGDVEISTTEYARAVQSQMNAFQRQTGQQVNFQTAQAFGIDRRALGELISAAALENEAQQIGISAGDANVSDEIRKVSAFQGLSGEFDRQTYEMALRQSGLTPAEFEENVRTDLATGLLRRAVGAGVETPQVFVDTLYAYARETRDVTWARLDAGDLAQPVAEPTDEELASFLDENSEQFMRPETKTIRYAWITPDMLAPEITVEDEQLRSLYEARIDEFVTPERRLVERLVFADEAAAQAAKARLDAEELTFDALVAERGLTLQDVDMGDVTEGELGAAGEAVFALEEPGVVGPLPSDLGPALYRMNGVLAAVDVPFEDAREELAVEAAADRARRQISDLVPEIEDLLAGGADPATVAERTPLETGEIDWNKDVFDGVAAYDGFREAAAGAKPGDFGEVIELDDGGIVTLAVEAVQPPELPPLEEIRDAVAEAWTREATQQALVAQAEALAEELRGGAEMAGMDLELETSRGLTRDGFVDGTPPDFISTVFGLEQDGVAVLGAEGDAWLIRLDAIETPDGDAPQAQAEKAMFAAQVAQGFSNALTAAYTQALINRAGADINSAAINAVNTQLP